MIEPSKIVSPSRTGEVKSPPIETAALKNVISDQVEIRNFLNNGGSGSSSSFLHGSTLENDNRNSIAPEFDAESKGGILDIEA